MTGDSTYRNSQPSTPKSGSSTRRWQMPTPTIKSRFIRQKVSVDKVYKIDTTLGRKIGRFSIQDMSAELKKKMP